MNELTQIAPVSLATPTTDSAVPAIYGAIAAASADLAREGVAKGQRNAAQGFNFRGIDDLQNACAPVLAAHRITVIPTYSDRTVTTYTTAKEIGRAHV